MRPGLALGIVALGCVARREAPCEARKQERAADLPFALLDAQLLERPDGTAPASGIDDVRLVDLDDDGRSDLLLNHRGEHNRVFVSRAGYCGAFGPLQALPLAGPVVEDPAWVDTELLLAHVDRDAVPELVWTRRDLDESWLFVGRLDRTQDPPRLAVRGGVSPAAAPDGACSSELRTLVADLDGDDRDDLIWTTTDRSVCAAVARADELGDYPEVGELSPIGLDAFLAMADLSVLAPELRERLETFAGAVAVPLTGDVDGDGRAELLLSYLLTTPNFVAVAGLPRGGAVLEPRGGHAKDGTGWGSYTPVVGDLDGENGDDIGYLRVQDRLVVLYSVLSGRAGALAEDRPWVTVFLGGEGATARLGRFDHDRIADLLHVRPEAPGQRLALAHGTPDGSFGRALDEGEPILDGTLRNEELSPDAAPPLVGDVDGDGLDDVVWIEPGPSTFRVQAALTTPEGP